MCTQEDVACFFGYWLERMEDWSMDFGFLILDNEERKEREKRVSVFGKNISGEMVGSLTYPPVVVVPRIIRVMAAHHSLVIPLNPSNFILNYFSGKNEEFLLRVQFSIMIVLKQLKKNRDLFRQLTTIIAYKKTELYQ